MNAGTDLDLGDTTYIKYLPVALKDNLVQLETIRRAVLEELLPENQGGRF